MKTEDLRSFTPFQLVCLGYNSADGARIIFVPLCSQCRKPILDFSRANVEVSVSAETGRNLISVWGSDGRRYLREPGDTYALHKDCCPEHSLGAWKPLDTVLKADQRYSWEIPSPATNGGRHCQRRKR
jgi:hypothetical protein